MQKLYRGMTSIRHEPFLCLFSLMSGFFFALHFIPWLQVDFWRHDSLYYVNSYDNKLISEGRWINFLLFPALRYIPAALACSLSYLGLIAFVYAISRRLGLLSLYAVLVAILVANIPLFRIQMEWPATLVPSYLILWFAALVADRWRDYVFFPLFSVLFFGVISSFYFLLPLLFLRNLRLGRMLRLLSVWSVSFPLGYVVSNVVVYVAVGHGVEIADWRNPNPIEGVADLSENLHRVRAAATAHFADLVKYSSPLVLLFSACIALLVCSRIHRLWVFGVAACCSLALYVTTIPTGIVISARTAGVAWAAALIGMFVIDRLPSSHQRLMGVPIVLLSASLAWSTFEYTRWYRAVTDGLISEAEYVLSPAHPSDAVFVVANRQDWQAAIDSIQRRTQTAPFLTETMATPLYWRALLWSRGFERITLCPSHENRSECVWARDQLISGQSAILRGAYFGSLTVGDGAVIWASESYM